MRKALAAILFVSMLPTAAHAQQRTLSRSQLQEFVAVYDLADGRVLAITRERHCLVAQLDGQDAVALQPAGPASFTASNGALRIDFDQRRNGNVAGVTVSAEAAPARR